MTTFNPHSSSNDSPSAANASAGDGSAARILVAEDNRALGSVVRFNLERAGFEVTLVRNGREALDQVSAGRFDLIITDQQMPEMSGCEFCQQMREIERYRRTPVFLLTAKGLELDLRSVRDQLGISAAFAKPFSPSRIVQEAQRVLARRTAPSDTVASES